MGSSVVYIQVTMVSSFPNRFRTGLRRPSRWGVFVNRPGSGRRPAYAGITRFAGVGLAARMFPSSPTRPSAFTETDASRILMRDSNLHWRKVIPMRSPRESKAPVICAFAAALAILLFVPSVNSNPPPELVPLIGTPPAWYTSEVHEKAIEAGARGMFYDWITKTFVPAFTPHVPETPFMPDYLFIRPGSMMISPILWCTMNFVYDVVYTNGVMTAAKIGTAGHCAGVGDPIAILAAPSLVTAIGTVTASHNGGPGDDWALAQISSSWLTYVDPTVAYMSGPHCAGFTSWTSLPQRALHVGHGDMTGAVFATPRTAEITTNNPNGWLGSWGAEGVAAGGDSGSPLVRLATDLGCDRPMGILTHCYRFAGTDLCDGTFFGSKIGIVPATPADGFTVTA